MCGVPVPFICNVMYLFSSKTKLQGEDLGLQVQELLITCILSDHRRTRNPPRMSDHLNTNVKDDTHTHSC